MRTEKEIIADIDKAESFMFLAQTQEELTERDADLAELIKELAEVQGLNKSLSSLTS